MKAILRFSANLVLASLAVFASPKATATTGDYIRGHDAAMKVIEVSAADAVLTRLSSG